MQSSTEAAFPALSLSLHCKWLSAGAFLCCWDAALPSTCGMLLLCGEKPGAVATPVREQAVLLFLGEKHYTEFSLMDGRKITVAHPLVPSKCPPAVLILLH